ncbi:TadE/TadG family type IV pilus assembly protein [Agromyces atrinae]|uniref:TadE/TadG family type IV pilus assembly protein n=1 Tax=Agromyces atrinae TaxID=592376 RepID=UPI00241103FA|nr:TadE/TadG family type IV pilus assembly protein [Agromyces atrinae]
MAEFSLVSVLLTALVLGVVQLALALHVRNTTLDAAAEGARYAALADTGLDAGIERTKDLIATAVGPAYTTDVSAAYVEFAGVPAVGVRVVTSIPLVGLLGVERGLDVSGHAALESMD